MGDNIHISDIEALLRAEEAKEQSQPTKADEEAGSKPASAESKPAPAELDQEEPTEVDDLESDDDDDPDQDDHGAQESDEEIPELDESITDPQARKRWAEQWKGVFKQRARLEIQAEALEAKEKEFEANREHVQGLLQIGQSLQERSTYRQALKSVIEAVAAEHGDNLTDLLSSIGLDQFGQDTLDGDLDDLDQRLVSRAKQEALKEFEAKYGFSLTELKQNAQKQKEEAALAKSVEDNFKRTRDKVAKLNDGFVLTTEMLAKAIKNHPGADPYKAVTFEFSDEIITHRIDKGKTKKAPELQRSISTKPVKRKLENSHDWIEAIKELGNSL